MIVKTVEIKNDICYPIFKCGSSSIREYAFKNRCRWYINEQIRGLKNISVFFRSPVERFISGVHSFIEFEKRKDKNLKYETMLYGIANHGVENEHFRSQYHYIKDLSKFFKKELYIRPFSDLLDIIPNRKKPLIPKITKEQKEMISKISYPPLRYDEYVLLNFLHKKINIIDLIEETEKNALSSS